MASQINNWMNNGYFSQFSTQKSPYSVDPFTANDSAYGASMIPRSNLINADKLRDVKNASYGAYGTLGQYGRNPLVGDAGAPTGFSAPSTDAFQKLMAASTAEVPNYEAITGVPEYASDTVGQPFSDITTEAAGLLSDKVKDAMLQGAEMGALSLVSPTVNMLGQRITGSRLGGNLAGTAASTALAASQGFTNPISDAAALMNALKALGIF